MLILLMHENVESATAEKILLISYILISNIFCASEAAVSGCFCCKPWSSQKTDLSIVEKMLLLGGK